MLEKFKTVANPLTVIAIFAGFAEVSGTVVLPMLSGEVQAIFLWFVISFPFVLICFFFATLNWNHIVLYAPSDYRKDKSFLDAISKQTPQEISKSLKQKVHESMLDISLKDNITAGEEVSLEPIENEKQDSDNSGIYELKSLRAPDNILINNMLAEDLSLRKMEQEYGVQINKDVRIDGVFPTLFDGYATRGDEFWAFEVKFLTKPYFNKKMLNNVYKQCASFASYLKDNRLIAKFILLVVVDMPMDDISKLKEFMSQEFQTRSNSFDYKLLDFNELKEEFGLAE